MIGDDQIVFKRNLACALFNENPDTLCLFLGSSGVNDEVLAEDQIGDLPPDPYSMLAVVFDYVSYKAVAVRGHRESFIAEEYTGRTVSGDHIESEYVV